MWIERQIAPYLRSLARSRPVVVLTGPRQTGKTSLLRRIFPRHGYASLDLPLEAAEAEESGGTFLERLPAPLIVDEIQYAPALLRHIKARVDADRARCGRFLLTGSQKFLLMQGVSESLAGRAAVVALHSLSLSELERWSGHRAGGNLLMEWCIAGGYPELHARGLAPDRYYADYVATYIERDVRHALEVRNLRDFERFMRLLALRSGQLLSLSSIATDVGVSPNTAKSWLSVLEASNVIYLLEPYFRNLGKRIVKAPKLYFLDTGLLCFLAGLRSVRDLRASSLLGSIFETLALGQWLRMRANRGLDSNIYYYRDHYGREVDFVVPVGEKLHLIECKWSESPDPNPRGFAELERLLGPGNVLSRTLVGPGRTRRSLQGGRVRLSSCVEIELPATDM